VKYGEFNDPGMMGHRIAYGATTKINRKDFGLTFSMMLYGKFVVSDEVQIMIEGELVEQTEPTEGSRQLILGWRRVLSAAAMPSRLDPDPYAGRRRNVALADHCGGPGRVGGRQRRAPPGTMAT
jgi:hypothetical protein